MQKLQWFERQFQFGVPTGMLPFYLERLSGTVTRIESKVAGVSDEHLSQKLDGKWSVKQNIGHLAEVDEIALKRIDEMINGVAQMSPAVFEPRHDYNSQPIKHVVDYLRTCREKNTERYSNLTVEELSRQSLHPRLKVKMNPVDLAFFDAEHDDHHLVRINEILSSLRTQGQ